MNIIAVVDVSCWAFHYIKTETYVDEVSRMKVHGSASFEARGSRVEES